MNATTTRVRVDIDECPETGTLIDYILVDDNGHIVARLGPQMATEHEKEMEVLNLNVVVGMHLHLEPMP